MSWPEVPHQQGAEQGPGTRYFHSGPELPPFAKNKGRQNHLTIPLFGNTYSSWENDYL